MRRIKNMKWFLIAGLLALFVSGSVIAATQCSASATMCQASCYVTAPPGGSTRCHSCPNGAICKVFDASGSLLYIIQEPCSPIP